MHSSTSVHSEMQQASGQAPVPPSNDAGTQAGKQREAYGNVDELIGKDIEDIQNFSATGVHRE